jgi:hypothetical protein
MLQPHDVLGFTATEQIKSIVGVIDHITFSLSGSIQYGINPKSEKNNSYTDAYSHDYETVVIAKPTKKKPRITPTNASPKFELGEMVALKTNNKAFGFVYRITIFLNGCVAYTIAKTDATKFTGDDHVFAVFEPMLKSIQVDSEQYDESKPETYDHRTIATIPPEMYQLYGPEPIKEAGTNKKTVGGPSTKLQRPA